MPPLASVTATPTHFYPIQTSLQLPLHTHIYIHIYIYIQETLLQIFFLHSSSTSIFQQSQCPLPAQRRKTPPKIRNSPSPAFLYPHDTCHYLINTTISPRSFSLQQVPPGLRISILRVCVYISLARISRRRTKNNATRRKKRGKTRTDRTLTRRARPEAFPRDGNRLWAPELAAPLGRRTHAAVRMRRPAPTTGSSGERWGGGRPRGNPLTWTCSFSRRLACTLPISFTCGFSCSGGST